MPMRQIIFKIFVLILIYDIKRGLNMVNFVRVLLNFALFADALLNIAIRDREVLSLYSPVHHAGNDLLYLFLIA